MIRKIVALIALVLALSTGVVHGAAGGTSSSVPVVQVAPTPQEICITRWHWDDSDPEFSYWRTPYPNNTLGLLDLRSLPQMGQGLPALGYGLFVLDSAGLCTGVNVLAALPANADSNIRLLEKTALEIGLGLPPLALNGATYRDVISELLIEEGDSTGLTRWKPLRGSLSEGHRIVLGGYGVYQESRGLTPQIRQNTIDVFQADYRRNLADGLPDEVLRRWTGAEMLKIWGEMSDTRADELMPPEHRSNGWEPPETTITESWACSNSDTGGTDDLDCDLTWTEVVQDFSLSSGKAYSTQDDPANEDVSARAESALSSDDHYVQAETDMRTEGSGRTRAGVAGRFASGATTYYRGSAFDFEDTIYIHKFVTGTPTELASTAKTISAPSTLTVRLEIDGSDLDLDVESTTLSVNDTSITGNLYTGIAARNASGDASWDDFEAADLNTAPTITSVVDSPDPVDYNVSLSFSVDWNDADASDQIKVHICKTDAITVQTCDGGSWADSASFTTSDPEVVSYTTQSADEGVQNYYAFVCDDDNACSASTSGTFDVEIKGVLNLPSADLRIPAQGEWTDHGTIETGTPAAWDAELFGSFSPGAVVKRDNKLYVYYIGADAVRGDGGPANRKLGVTICDFDTDDCLDASDWTKSSSNPIFDHVVGDDETGTFTVGANLRSDDSVVLWLGNMVNCGAGCVNDDVDSLISSDGEAVGSEVRLITHSDTNFEGYGDETDPLDAIYDGTDWLLSYSSANGNRSAGGSYTWGWIHVVCPDWDTCDDTQDNEVANDSYTGNVSPNYLTSNGDTIVYFAIEGANVFDGTGDKNIEVYTAATATPHTVTLKTTYTFTDIDNATVYLDTDTNTWWMFYLSTASEDIRVKTAPANEDNDLVVRYYVDEASSGQSPTEVIDSANTPLNLAITYDGANPSYTSGCCGEGLNWATDATNGIASVAIDSTKVKTELDGQTQVSMVFVAEIQGATTSNSRIFGIALGTESGRLMISAHPTNDDLRFYWGSTGEVNGGIWNNAWNESTPARKCYALVIDTTLGTAADRIVLYDESGLVTKTSGTDPALNAVTDFGTGRFLSIGNRTAGARAFTGDFYYGALYKSALSSAEVSTICTALMASDDPSARRIFMFF